MTAMTGIAGGNADASAAGPTGVARHTSEGAAPGIEPPLRAWATAPVAQLRLTEGPVVQAPVWLPGTPYAYWVAALSGATAARTGALVRVDLSDGSIARGPQVSSASRLMAVGDVVAVVSPKSVSPSGVLRGPYLLRLTNGHGASLGAGVKLEWSMSSGNLPSSLPDADGTAWLPTATGAQLLDLSSGRALRSITAGPAVSSIASSPDGRYLYVAVNALIGHPKGPVSTVLDEFRTTDARLVSHADIDFTVGPALLTATPGGLWASVRGGMAGTSDLFRAPSLKPVVASGHPRQMENVPQLGSDQIMGIWTVYLGGPHAWLVSGSGVSCVGASTGAFVAGTAFPDNARSVPGDWSVFAAWHGLLYATDANDQVIAVRPPAACGTGA